MTGHELTRDSMNINKRLRYLFLVLILLTTASTYLVAHSLYHTALLHQKEWLLEMAESQVEMIESVARFDSVHSKEDNIGGAQGATISQVCDAFKSKGFGRTGEFIFAKHDSGKMAFYYPPRHHKSDSLILELDDEPLMKKALSGIKGVGVAADYRGEQVLAAYAPVPSLNSGLVVKIDMAELRQPYLYSFFMSTGILSIFYLAGIFIFLGITRKIKAEVRERRQYEKELVKMRSFLSNIIDSMPSVLIGIDTSNRITHWNKEAEKVTLITADKAVGRLLSEVYSGMPLEQGEIQETITSSKARKKVNIFTQTKEGFKYENITLYPLVANGVAGVVLRIDDVTNTHIIEEQLNQSRKLDAIGQMAGGVAHDFNNMLSAIMGAADLLKSLLKSPDDIEYVDVIMQAAKQSSELTSRLLAFGRKSTMLFAPSDVHRIIDDSVGLLKRTIDKKISIDVKKNARCSMIIGDSSAIQNVLINLGINSSHAMPKGGNIFIETGNVELDKDYCEASPFEISPGYYIQISLRDNGCGIPSQNLNRIFEPFFTTTQKGTGLGLASVHRIVKDHHGAISVYSEEGKGTVFHVYIPCARDSAPDRQNDLQKIETGSGLILVADDEEMVRKVVKGMLTKMGYNVILAENGQEAVEIFKQNADKIDLVILDMIMPVMNGREAFGRIRQINGNCKVVIASGFWEDEDIEELKKTGLAGFLRKPLMMLDLSRMLKETLHGK